ncbi:MAG: acyl-CoA synthetase [Candidatus Binatia bacterium]|nr:MAG: acyl-CoA synthetase [Candidatus Binatia bacterium]
MSFTLPAIHDGIASLVPDREAVVTPNRRLSWAEFAERSRKLAWVLHGSGLGCHRARSALMPWESGQDHLGIYLYNCPEYLEAMVAAFRARVAPFNVNYRYVEQELLYLLRDARPAAIVYHASFAPRLAQVLPELRNVRLLLQVADDSGNALLPGALDYETALRDAPDEPLPFQPDPDDLYIVYTGGTTGQPKGVLWRQEDIFFAAMGGRVPGGTPVQNLEELLQRVPYGGFMRILPAPPFMHGAGHWTALMILHQGGTVVIPKEVRHLDPDDIWQTIEREKVFSLSIVGDAFAVPLLDQLERKQYDLSSLRVIGSGGALLSPSVKAALLERLPHVTVVDGFGSSETGAQGAAAASSASDVTSRFQMDADTVVLDERRLRVLQPEEREVGWIARKGYVPLGYLGDREKTERTFVTIEGVRYAVPGDRAHYAEDGSVVVLGRDSVCINTGGEKVYAEEVEQVLKKHPSVYDVLVTATPSERWGQQVTAVVALRPGMRATAQELRDFAARELARYKLPRAVVFVDHVVRSPTGKPDYRWARQVALEKLGISA